MKPSCSASATPSTAGDGGGGEKACVACCAAREIPIRKVEEN